jgi:hypothetical protein
MVKDRLDGRFLGFATKLMRFKHSGFIVLAIDSLLAETMQQFEDGCGDRACASRSLCRAQPGGFDHELRGWLGWECSFVSKQTSAGGAPCL